MRWVLFAAAWRRLAAYNELRSQNDILEVVKLNIVLQNGSKNFVFLALHKSEWNENYRT